MKRKNRFMTTEIYPDGIFAVHKVIVDTDTQVAYYLHQEGSTASMCLLVDRDGKPLIVENPTPAKIDDPMRVDMRDRIHKRKEEEPLIELEPVVIRRKEEKQEAVVTTQMVEQLEAEKIKTSEKKKKPSGKKVKQ